MRRQLGASDPGRTFLQTAVQLSHKNWLRTGARSVGRVARDLDLTESALRTWVARARADRTKGRAGLTTEEREELRHLRKENRRLRMERDVLKRAAVGEGFVIDSYGGTSRQQDVVLYERDICPVFSINKTPQTTYYPCEGVIGIGEVKSSLDGDSLQIHPRV